MKAKTYTLLTVIFFVSTACAMPFISEVTPDPLSEAMTSTAIANSIYTNLTQTAIAIPASPTALATPVAATNTATALPTATSGETPTPNLTPSPTITLTQTPTPLLTQTPIGVFISVSQNTNCRTGPGKIYDYVGALLVGETTEVVGREATRNYWYVRNPDRKGQYCWLWGEYATIVGDTSRLPILTPPPTPTPRPNFSAEYIRHDSCSGVYFVFDVNNTGGITFQSYQIELEDTETGAIVTRQSNTFETWKGCNVLSSNTAFYPGKNIKLPSAEFIYIPTHHKIHALFILCTADELKGSCITKELNFVFTPSD